MTSVISFARKERVGYITLDRQKEKNIISQQMAQEMEEICSRINQDEGVYVAVITGAGEVFCAGGEYEQSPGADVAAEKSLFCSAARAIAGLNCPVIAAINGDALGQGLELALACDIRLASDTARFGLPQVGKGLIPGDGGTQRLPRIVGKGKALEMVLTGGLIDARAALEIGLVSRVVAAKVLASEAETMAQNIASKAPIALKYVKEAVNGGLDLTMQQGLGLEADLYFILHTTADRTEGIRAFLEKRPPEFKGQ